MCWPSSPTQQASASGIAKKAAFVDIDTQTAVAVVFVRV